MVKSEPVNQKGTCLGTLTLQLSIALNHYRGPWLSIGHAHWHLPKTSQAEFGSWDNPRATPDEQFLISLISYCRAPWRVRAPW